MTRILSATTKIVKDWGFRVCEYFWMAHPRSVSELSGKAFRKLLVVQLQNLGDSLVATPLIHALHLRFPLAQIDLLTSPVSQNVYEHSSDVTDCLPLQEWTLGGIARWLGVLVWLPKLRRKRYDWILCDATETAFSYGLLAWLTGIPVRLGFEWRHRGFLFTHALSFPELDAPESMVKINLRYCNALGIPGPDSVPFFPVRPENRHRITRWLLQDVGRSCHPLVVIHPGSKFPANHWISDRFISIAQWLVDAYRSVVIFAGAPEEVFPFQELFGQSESILNWGGRTSLDDLAALFETADVAIVLDSGPSHLAAAVKTNTIVLRSARAPRGFWNYSLHNWIDLWNEVPCSPCEAIYCQNRRHPRWCMDLITVDVVKQAVQRFLGAPS